jgi:hypothetical protein
VRVEDLLQGGTCVSGLEVAGELPDALLEVQPEHLLGLPAREGGGEAIRLVLLEPLVAVLRLKLAGQVDQIVDTAMVAGCAFALEQVLHVID